MGFKALATGLRRSGLVLAVVAGAAVAAPAEAGITAFKQAVAEAASEDRDIAAFYRENGFSAVWTGAGDEQRNRRSALLSAMEAAGMHGLPAGRYETARLLRLLADVRTPRDRGLAEVAMSRAFIRIARDMQSGVLDPASVDDGIKRKGTYKDASTYLAGLVSSDHPRAYFRTLLPQTREYTRLLREKIRLERLIENGGWGPQVPGGALEVGQSGPAVIALRDRLMAMGYLKRTSTMVYDANIEDAVRRYQMALGLEPDGKAGDGTLTELNKSPATRLALVLVAMERERWLNKERGARHILVNLTDFSARIIDNDRITFETRAVVGANSHDRRSPEFSDEMEHLVINPSWYVPRSITVNEYLPQLRANPGAAAHLQIIDGSGRPVSRAGINFAAYTGNTFPFDLKQPPSRGNALGLVKFMFPNQYNIYLHDTPSKHLFARARRAYSHGCIRLAQPFDFAYEILSRQEEDPKGFFHSVLDSGQETKVELQETIPVHIIYRTAFSDARGEMHYRPDVYGRDARIWAALKQAGIESPALQLASMDIPQAQYFPTPRAAPAPAATVTPVRAVQPQVQAPARVRTRVASGGGAPVSKKLRRLGNDR